MQRNRKWKLNSKLMKKSANKSWPFSHFLKLGLVLAAVGYIPLQLYIIFGPPDGNPIGLGLLFVVGVFAGLSVIGVGAIAMLWQFLRDRGQ